MEDIDRVVLQSPALPLGTDPIQRDSALVVRENLVQIQAQCASGELEEPAKELKHLGHALVVAGQRAPAGDVIADRPG